MKGSIQRIGLVLKSRCSAPLHLKLALCISIALSFCGSAVAQTNSAVTISKAEELTQARDKYAPARANARKVAARLIANGLPGLSVAVAVDGRLVYSEGFGFADLEQRVPVWPATKFRIGSVSKPFTAAALMKLLDQGKIDLDAPVQKYVPSFPDKGATITPRLLSGHLAGVRHYLGDEMKISQHYDSVLDGLKVFQADPLVSEPGSKFNYSSFGYNLLSAAIESASGEKFTEYMKNEVFLPLGLLSSSADENSKIISQRARYYELTNDHTYKNAPYVDNSYKWAGGGFLSTSEDMVAFGSALLKPGFLSASSLKLMFTPQNAHGVDTTYGIGWNVATSQTGKKIYEHRGGSVGGASQLIIYPDSSVVVAFATNLSEAPFHREDIESIAEAFDIPR